jgi:ubiquinone biosynthesis protein UbiJ
MRAKTAERIRRDLEERGVASEFSRSVSDRLEPFAGDLTADVYEAVLSGVAMAYGVHRRGDLAALQGESSSDLDEMHRLMSDFASELHKLDEALEVLAAYLTRLRTQALPPERVRTLH